MLNVMEAHKIFKDENPYAKIGKSKFFEFRPKNIHIMADIPHNVCICKTHGNMDELLSGISKVIPSVASTGRALIDAHVCRRESAACMLSICNECADSVLKIEQTDDECESNERIVKWKRWEDIGATSTG